MTSVPKPLKFLRPHYDTLKQVYEKINDDKTKVGWYLLNIFQSFLLHSALKHAGELHVCNIIILSVMYCTWYIANKASYCGQKCCWTEILLIFCSCHWQRFFMQASSFMETEKSGPEKSWNWTLVLKKAEKLPILYHKGAEKSITLIRFCGALVRPAWSKLCSTVTVTFDIIDNKAMACSFTVSCFDVKFIGWGPKWC